MRKLAVGKWGYAWLVAAVSAAVLVPFSLASGGTTASQVSCLNWGTRTTSATTTSTNWRKISGLEVNVATLAQNFAVQFSGTFSGPAVMLRIQDATTGGTFTLSPGSVTLTPPSGKSQPFSFTWVGTSPAEHPHTFDLQWRLQTSGSGTAKLNLGAMTTLYQGAPTPTNC